MPCAILKESTGIGSITTQFPMNCGNMPTQVLGHGCDGYFGIAPVRNLVALSKAECCHYPDDDWIW